MSENILTGYGTEASNMGRVALVLSHLRKTVNVSRGLFEMVKLDNAGHVWPLPTKNRVFCPLFFSLRGTTRSSFVQGLFVGQCGGGSHAAVRGNRF